MADGTGVNVVSSDASQLLRAFVERIERLEADKAEATADIKEVYAEAKGGGFDTKIIRKVIKRRSQDRAKLHEEESLLDMYLTALGELPLFSDH